MVEWQGASIYAIYPPPIVPCFAQNPTQALSSSDLQLLLGLPLSGSSGGYAHQTTLRLFSLLYKRSSNQDLSGCLSSNGLEFESSEVLKGLSQAWGCGLGVGHPGHGTEGRGRRRRQCSVAVGWERRSIRAVPGEAGRALCLDHTATSLGCSTRPTNHSPLLSSRSQSCPKRRSSPWSE